MPKEKASPVLFSKKVFALREKLGYTQGEMADAMGMGLRMYQDYEGGKFDDSPGDSRRRKHEIRMAEIEAEHAAKMARLAMIPVEREGSLEKTIADMQRQIDTLNGKLARLEERLNLL